MIMRLQGGFDAMAITCNVNDASLTAIKLICFFIFLSIALRFLSEPDLP